ncbi:cell envelope integrity protein TolA [Desulfobacula toluolica]|uniref:TolA: putative TonB family protein n=1 Tax=Desulfobacula toluolica (strain DSM 7467 / Tol2) TaxID=651182 RepID=K0NF03_DESTT|nr:cell envelope integrity protein TolA [Desulfobacula toluolica]CCK79515.1 TolA: putative TonB family protein [Desulfobacula toluolica Tol2]
MSLPIKVKIRKDSFLTPDHGRKTGIVFFSISVVLHGLFFCGMIFCQDIKLSKPLPSVIQIDLVSFSPEPAFEEPAKSQDYSTKKGEAINNAPIIQKAPVIKKNRTIPNFKPDISLKAKPKNLKDLIALQEKKRKESDNKKENKPVEKKPVEKKPVEKKPVEKKKAKKEIDPEKVLESARKQLEKKVEDQSQAKLEQALSRIQKKVQEQGKANEDQGKGAYAGYGKKGYEPIELYKMVLGSRIEQNWVFNETLARMNQGLEVRILIKVLKSGEIRDIIYETRSGNRYLDESAKKAIKKANPLPQLPGGRHSYDVIVIFTPRGLK